MGELRLDGAIDVAVDMVDADSLDQAVSLQHPEYVWFSRASRNVTPLVWTVSVSSVSFAAPPVRPSLGAIDRRPN